MIIYIVAVLVVSLLAAAIAEAKNRSRLAWAFLTFVFSVVFTPVIGILLMLAVGLMPSIPKTTDKEVVS